MMDSKIISLIENLRNKTRKGLSKWVRVGKGELFQLKLETGQITIDKFFTKTNNVVYQLAVLNIDGDRIRAVAVNSSTGLVGVQDYELLKTLHEDVKNAYFRVDETLDDILGEIEKEGEIGKEEDELPF